MFIYLIITQFTILVDVSIDSFFFPKSNDSIHKPFSGTSVSSLDKLVMTGFTLSS